MQTKRNENDLKTVLIGRFYAKTAILTKLTKNGSVEDYLAFCTERGEDPEKPYSGKFLVRVGPELHKTPVIQALKNGKSLNTWLHDALNKVVKDGTQHQIS